jgi:hypothetical protein
MQGRQRWRRRRVRRGQGGRGRVRVRWRQGLSSCCAHSSQLLAEKSPSHRLQGRAEITSGGGAGGAGDGAGTGHRCCWLSRRLVMRARRPAVISPRRFRVHNIRALAWTRRSTVTGDLAMQARQVLHSYAKLFVAGLANSTRTDDGARAAFYLRNARGGEVVFWSSDVFYHWSGKACVRVPLHCGASKPCSIAAARLAVR